MHSSKDIVRQHYDQHVNLNVSTQEALAMREQGQALPLKQFHNDIKRSLLRRFATGKDNLLDLCCGRGGDIAKWVEAKLKYVRGVDISEAEVKEAARRWREHEPRAQEAARRHKVEQLYADFQVEEHLGEAEFDGEGPYDVVTCMFAIHYFYDMESRLRMFLRNVSQNLKPGGLFIATLPDGHRIMWHTRQAGAFNSRMLRLVKDWQGTEHQVDSPFGNRYFFAMTDTVTAGAGSSEGSYEFLTFKTPLMRLAAHYGLEALPHYDAPALDHLFEPEDADSPFKHFMPQFAPQADPDGSLAVASSINMAVVFRKVEPGQAMCWSKAC
ncbi:mRNA capping enzyme-domain-containing protein [Haematococcus lacustris]